MTSLIAENFVGRSGRQARMTQISHYSMKGAIVKLTF